MPRSYVSLPTWAKHLYTQTVARAKKRGDAFELTRDDYAAIFSDKCALTGIPFEFEKLPGRHQKRPFAASIDRIDSSKGYLSGNCRLVCVAVNLAMNAWGEAVLYRIAAGLTRDRAAWRVNIAKNAGELPRGIKVHYTTVEGPMYTGSKYVNGIRMFTRAFPTPEQAVEALNRNDFSKRKGRIRPKLGPEDESPTAEKAQVAQ